MSKASYQREVKEVQPVIAICYDFDKTLSPTDMQAQGYIQSVGHDVEEFWKKSNGLAENNDMDQNLAYMFSMREAAAGQIVFTRKKLLEYGSQVQLFPGVEEWFERIREYGKEHGVLIEHYIISSGLKEMIEGTSVAQSGAFKKIFASSFYYDENDVAVWPAQVVNYTNKTQFLFRIEKGVLDINDPGVNDYFSPEEIRVPFRNMIYIGDSDTDIPCMKLVSTYGGYSIGVYNSETKDKTKVYKMMRDKRIKYYAPADYREGTEIDVLVKEVIDRTEANEKLEEKFIRYSQEVAAYDRSHDRKKQNKAELMIQLENSRSFANTHTIIKKMAEIEDWNDEMERLCSIAFRNSQVQYILQDMDVANFYLKNLSRLHVYSETEKRVYNTLNKETDETQ